MYTSCAHKKYISLHQAFASKKRRTHNNYHYPALDIDATINEGDEGGNIGVFFLLVGKIAVHLVGGVVMLARLAKGHTSADYLYGT